MVWTTVGIVLQLIFLEGILSIDNAAVLGAMVSTLPDDRPIAWPPALHSLGAILQPLAGNQRTAALRVGLLGAYVGRGTMLVLASLVIQNPWLKIIGALYLVRLAFENLGMAESGEEAQFEQAHQLKAFWVVVLNVELADLIFSLDNVVAAVSLSKTLWVVMIGVAIGIVTMRFAAGLFAQAILKEPILKPAAYVLVLNIGVQLLLEELFQVEIPDLARFGISVAIIALALLYARSRLLQRGRPVLVWLAQGMDTVNELFNWALAPLRFGLRTAGALFRRLLGKARPRPAE